MNKVILCGYLGRDPELRYTQSGQAVANVSVATTEKWNNEKGERQERTEWHRLVIWGKQAEYVSNYLRKGSRVLVEGRIQTQEWEDAKTHEKKRSTQIVVATITNLSGAKQDGEGESKPRHSVPREDPPTRRELPPQPPEEDDIPF